ncbi:MAG TPA: hypothetical protein VF608_11850, partial [Thermoanaerobaculia bacterium]
GRVIDAIGRDARGDEARSIAERARVELGGDLTHDAIALEPLGPFDHFFLGHFKRLSEKRERRGNERNLSLQSTQQLPVPLIHFLHLDPSAW